MTDGHELSGVEAFATVSNVTLKVATLVDQLVGRMLLPGRLSVITGDRGTGHTDFSFLLIDRAMRTNPQLALVLTTSWLLGGEARRWGDDRVYGERTASALVDRLWVLRDAKRPTLVFIESSRFLWNRKRTMDNSIAFSDSLLGWIRNGQQSMMLDSSRLDMDFDPMRAPPGVRYGAYVVKTSLPTAIAFAEGVGQTYRDIPPTTVRYCTASIGGFKTDTTNFGRKA